MSEAMAVDIPQGTTTKDPGIVASLLWLLGLVGFQVLGMAIAMGIQMATTGGAGQPDAVTLMFGVLIGSLLMIAMRSKYMMRHLRPAWEKGSPYAITGQAIITTILLVVATGLFTAVNQSTVIADKTMQPELQIFLNAINSGTIGIIAVYLVGAIAAPVLEEVLFRGQLQGAIQNSLDTKVKNAPVFAIGITSAIFALIHFQPYAIPPLFFAGCAFGWIRWRTGSLALPILGHIILNAFSLTILMITGTV